MSWEDLHRQYRDRGGYLGDDWGSDAYVDEVVRRFCLPHADPDGLALEIGPGGGRYTERLLAHVGELHAVDVSRRILEDLDYRLSFPANLRSFVGDGRTLAGLGLAEKGYELVCSFNLFLFLDLETIHSYLSDLRALLADSGLAVVQYADFSSPGGKAFFREHRDEWMGETKPFGRFAFYTKNFVEEILRDVGFDVAFHETHGRDAFVGFAHAGSRGLERHRAVARTIARSPRRQTARPGLDAEEAAWWAEHAKLELEECWVQTPVHRRILRRAYVAKIAESVPPGGTVLDFGCGTGWLCELLAEFGATSVHGVDESEAQIAIARSRLALARDPGAIHYAVGRDVPDDLRADVVVCHAILHHLSWDEIRRVVAKLRSCVKPGGTLWLFEPVLGARPPGAWAFVPDVLLGLFSTWNGSRRVGDEEKRLRSELAESRTGDREPGHGPSPKELPFRLGEIEAAVSRDFERVSFEPSLLRAHLVATEQILFAKTFPKLGGALAAPAAWIAARWDRLALRFSPDELWQGWNFCLFRFRRR
jgi:2-polyprenyl-3-methyl-5-hydroxy-6-metoxy-1,4-benzoquinol methylase